MNAVMFLPVGILSQRVTQALSATSRSQSRFARSRTARLSAMPSPTPAAPITGSSATAGAESPSGDAHMISGNDPAGTAGPDNSGESGMHPQSQQPSTLMQLKNRQCRPVIPRSNH